MEKYEYIMLSFELFLHLPSYGPFNSAMDSSETNPLC